MIVWLYNKGGMQQDPGTDAVISSVHSDFQLPFKMAPLIFVSTVITKLVFTMITLACGYKGGEIVPSFFVGATFGAVVGGLLHLPAGFGAAIGLISVFCGAVNCPLASIILSVELFGAEYLPLFGLSCAISYTLSGYFGLYGTQKILYSKIKTQYINRFTH